MVSLYQSSQSTDFSNEYDEDYFLARQLEREEKEFRRREEEKNRLAVTKILDQEKKIARQKRRSQFEENSKLELELQKQWIFEYEQQCSLRDEIKHSSFVSYSILLQEHQEEKESLKVAQHLQAEEEENQRYKQMKQEYDDRRMAFKMTIRIAMMEVPFPEITALQSSRYVARLLKPNETSLNRCNSCHPLTSSQKDDEKTASRLHTGERMKKVIARMFKEHTRFESKAKRKVSKKEWRFCRYFQRSTSTAAIITSPSLLFSRSMDLC